MRSGLSSNARKMEISLNLVRAYIVWAKSGGADPIELCSNDYSYISERDRFNALRLVSLIRREMMNEVR
jgi:hypothetical protein